MMATRRPADTAVMWLAIMALSTALASSLWRYDQRVMEERHIIEMSQAALLMIACGIHAVRVFRCASMRDSTCRMGLALLCLTLAVRETDIDEFGASTLWPVAESVLRGILVMLWVVLGVVVGRRYALLLPAWRQAAFGSCAVYTVAGGMLYLLSYPFDKTMVPLAASPSMFVEEALQMNACILMLAAATLPIARRCELRPGMAVRAGAPRRT